MLAVSAAVSICRSTARCSVDWEDNNLRFPEKKTPKPNLQGGRSCVVNLPTFISNHPLESYDLWACEGILMSPRTWPTGSGHLSQMHLELKWRQHIPFYLFIYLFVFCFKSVAFCCRLLFRIPELFFFLSFKRFNRLQDKSNDKIYFLDWITWKCLSASLQLIYKH